MFWYLRRRISDFESTTSNQDREMDAIYEQTKSFEKVCCESFDISQEVQLNLQDLLAGGTDGPVRDSNGFYDVRSTNQLETALWSVP